MVWSPDKEFDKWWKENKDEIMNDIEHNYPYITGYIRSILEDAFQKGYDYCDDLWANTR